jgi:hypothetical protein
MATDPRTIAASASRSEVRPSIASLLSGLIEDLRLLVQQEMLLAKHEINYELGKAKSAAAFSLVGIGLLALGGLLLIIMLVHALQALTGLPFWACYGLVGGALAVGGGSLIVRGRSRASELDFVPRTTLATLKENATWMKERARSVRT